MTLPKACAISRLSNVPFSGSLPKSRSKAMSERLTSTRNDASRSASRRSITFISGFGMRAKAENSSTMRPMSLDLADDRVGALVEHLAVLGDDLAVAAADALGRQLDRRQRVLDLVGDAARHVGPGGGALRLHEIGDVVDGDDVGLVVLRVRSPLLDRDLHVEGPLRAGRGRT